MCGRYVLINGKRVFLTYKELRVKDDGHMDEHLPRYNAAPMQHMPVFAQRGGELIALQMLWWLIPHTSKDGKPASVAFNARAETIETSALFAPYFKGSRCLIPADAFYEWKKISVSVEAKGKMKLVEEKHPMCICMKNEQPFMFAGLFSVWKNDKGEEFPSFTIITTAPNALMSEIHHRMPVIMPERHFEMWLDRTYKNTGALKKMLVPFPASEMKAYRVSSYVNNARNEGPECMKKVE